MTQPRRQESPIRSSLASDPEFGELVEQFAAEMPARVAWLQRHFDAGDWEALRRAAHQMNGAAASYGFDKLAPFARGLETLLAKGASRDEITPAFQELVARCRRVVAEPSHA
jgi:HPt (histidine-containing phosphotransfer) domain-containing protein